jgi:imidazolonepropionase-like amidohydrolase
MRIRLALGILLAASLTAQTAPPTLAHGKRYPRLIIRNAMVIEGNGTPAAGPKDIIIENNRIVDVVAADPVSVGRTPGMGGARRPAPSSTTSGAVEYDATGKYVMPGLVNAHAHIQDERGGIPQPLDYELKIWLSCGITTIRDVGSDTVKTLKLREQSAKGEVAAPRIFAYPMLGRINTPEEGRARVRQLKEMGADGIKLLGIYRNVMQAVEEEAHQLNLPIAHHIGVEETNAWDDINFGSRSIEHWYGIPDAALPDGVQAFPSYYNYNNETDRFRWAGHLWREAEQTKLMKVLDAMVEHNVAWVPTFDIYEASRDLQRAQTQPWFADYLHPTLEDYFKPNPKNHGSYFFGWSSTDESYWKENYRIWMAAVREFERRGGLVATGDDAGFIYQMYGFGLLRELELHQEAGFPTLKVLQHATQNGARVLFHGNEFGRVRGGFLADLLIVNGNPLENLKVLYPTGIEDIKDGKAVHTGGVEWTIKDGISYHVPTMMAEVKEMVAKARAERNRK